MNNRNQPATRSRQLTLFNLANPVITNGNHNAIKALNIFQQRSGVANNRPWPVLCQPRPGIIKKHHLIPARQPGSIGYHLAVATGTENGKAHQSLLPVDLDIVTSPSPLISSRTSTFFTVSNRIFTSSQSDRLSTYRTSSRNLSSQEIALRPFTCAQPVTPGRASWRRYCSCEYSGRYSINSGRGPTRLISPLSTFQSSGNSSRLVARRKLPNGVMR